MLHEHSRPHALWVASLMRIMMAVPTFCPRSGYELLKKVSKDERKDLQTLGRYTAEIIKNFLENGEIHIANTI